MDLPGSVGVLFSPKHSQVLSVCSADSGSSDYAGEEGSMGSTPDEDAINESLNVPSGIYNEWRIRGARPVGIFICDSQCMEVKQEMVFTVGGNQFADIICTSISLQAVKEAFPAMPVYTMGAEGLIQL